MKIVLNSNFSNHNPHGEIHQGKMVPSFENPSRLKHIIACLNQNGADDFYEPQDFGLTPIRKIHPDHYLSFLENIWEKWTATGRNDDILPSIWPAQGLKKMQHDNLHAKVGNYAFSSDTAIMNGTWDAVYLGAQTALTACHLVFSGERSSFALTRPPGHHAHEAQYGGYCFLNNAAIAAQAALDKGYKKVCVLDIDYHHGNGTQDIFYDRDDVLTISIHGHPESNFPYYLGYENEEGKDGGLGYNLNLPLQDGANIDIWKHAFQKAICKIQDNDVDFLVIPLGVDTYEGDPISKFKLKTDDFITIGTLIEAINLPSVFVMEGGYDVSPIGQNVYNVLWGFEEV